MELSDLEENNLELNNKIVEIKQTNKYSESSKITQLNEKVIRLENENDILENKIDLIEKRYKNLQEKYLKISSEKRKQNQEDLYLQSKNNVKKKKDNFSSNRSRYSSNKDKLVLPLINSMDNNDITLLKKDFESSKTEGNKKSKSKKLLEKNSPSKNE